MAALDAEQHRLSEIEHQRIFERRIVPALFSGVQPAETPIAVIFGGQPGAGKSASLEAAVDELQIRGGAAQIIGDDLRNYHPRYAELLSRDDKTAAFYTDRDSGRWVEKAIQHAKEQRVNLVIEGTMRDGAKVAETMTSLRAAGYEIDARALAVNERLSWQGVLQRYEAQRADRGSGRMTAPHSHRDAYEGMPLTLERIEREQLADRVSLYRRGGEAIYRNELTGGDWRQPPQARAVLEAERNRPFTLDERRQYAEGFDRLRESLGRPGRNALPAEVQAVDDLRERSHHELRAATFRELPPERAIKTHPELAGAYALLLAIERQARAHGQTSEQRSVIEHHARGRIADALERGESLTVQVRRELERGPEFRRDTGPER